MFDIGFWEILLIGVVTLLVVGPQRLPGVAVFAGHWIGRIRRFVRNMRDEINEELETEHLKSLLAEQNREINELRRDVDAVRGDTERSVREAGDSVREAGDSVREAEEQVRQADPGASHADNEADSSTQASTGAAHGNRGDTGDREEGTR